jgi:DNA polymerase V
MYVGFEGLRVGVFHLMDSGDKPMLGDIHCFELYGKRAVGKLIGQSIITRDGESLEGASVEDLVVLGKVTFMVSNYHEDSRPII